MKERAWISTLCKDRNDYRPIQIVFEGVAVGCEGILDYIPHGLSKAYQYYCFEQSNLGDAKS